ncbi:MAG: 2-hydroxyglutaryl-CoA dehydratase [Dehalococcoidia bacterium]|nr:2-hydroxyglutaryl-CoA dehydratase [Dehalococcoidia bacterium]
MRAVGIDVGSLRTKVAVMGDDGILSSAVAPSSDSSESSTKAALEQALARAGHDGDIYVVSTGAGGKAVSFSRQQKAITTCLARGIHYLLPEARTLIDMGAESITVVRINERGRVSDYGNQDKCAAGTGIFLQQMAKLLRLSMEEMATISSKAKARAEITGTCAVFAESEVISHIHRDPPTPVEDIVAGIYVSMVHRIMSQLQRVGIKKEVAVTGGVAANSGLVSILAEEVGHNVLIPPTPDLAGAIGAALIAKENMVQGAR